MQQQQELCSAEFFVGRLTSVVYRWVFFAHAAKSEIAEIENRLTKATCQNFHYFLEFCGAFAEELQLQTLPGEQAALQEFPLLDRLLTVLQAVCTPEREPKQREILATILREARAEVLERSQGNPQYENRQLANRIIESSQFESAQDLAALQLNRPKPQQPPQSVNQPFPQDGKASESKTDSQSQSSSSTKRNASRHKSTPQVFRF